MTGRRRQAHHRYRAWDGATAHPAIAPEDLLQQLGDRFLNEAAERVMSDTLHRGLTTEQGTRLAGIDDLRRHIRQQLRDLEARQLQQPAAGGSLDLSEQASLLLRDMAANPTRAGRLLDGASPGAIDELSRLTADGGLLQQRNPLARLLDLAHLDKDLRRARGIVDVLHLSADDIAAVLGDDLARQFAALRTTLYAFRNKGFIDPSGAGLTPQALRLLGIGLLRQALTDIESRLSGDHQMQRAGMGWDRADSTRSYQFGDPFDLDLSGTVLQAVRRSPGTPVRLRPRDMTIFEREETGRVAMVLAIDRSRSMGERGYLLAAKRMALALAAMIDTRFPRDRLDVLSFSNKAEPVAVPDLASLEWERYAVGTNIHDALVAGRRKLAETTGLQRTLVIITDGEPTAYRARSGEVCYTEPPSAEALAMTYAAARRLRRDRILLVVALLSHDRQTVKFAEQLVKEASGKLVVAEPGDLNLSMLMGYRNLRWS